VINSRLQGLTVIKRDLRNKPHAAFSVLRFAGDSCGKNNAAELSNDSIKPHKSADYVPLAENAQRVNRIASNELESHSYLFVARIT
jgi:hypothetical protein